MISVGDDSAAPVVVLHGGPGESHGYLRPHLDGLGRRVVYYDQQRGTPTWHDLVAQLDDVRRQLGVERLELCGFSWGALLALLYAVEHEGRLARAVLVSPPALYPQAQPAALPSDLAGYFADPSKVKLLGAIEKDERTAAAVSASLRGLDLRPALARARVKALVVRGERDPVPARWAEEAARLLGARLVEIPAAGHAPFVEAPQAFFAAARPFLEGL